ncbi:MAG: bifunctional riboflavin kinase/FAD synthetase [Betaproteobacteria bacterium]|nr:bifunctional riboflavin kinase/FAD synthetase [Betaproteobacteria bacterium]
MQVTRGAAPPSDPVALTIGNFDGVHLGHQAMLARARDAARERGLKHCVLTFEPHPREFFTPESAPTRLTSLREKLELLDHCGVERVHVQRFSREFAAVAPRAFVEGMLVRSLNARWVLVGEDFRFGAKRAGDLALLRSLGPPNGLEVESMQTVTESGVRVSSSAVRSALAAGELARAGVLLGRSYSISGRVVHGDRLGRTLGFATANVQVKHNRAPLAGIFAVRMYGAAPAGEGGGVAGGKDFGMALPGVASFGVRPTVTDSGRSVLEVHLFDFSGEIYGRHVRVEFLHKIRDEEKYSNLDLLKAQIARDCDTARALLPEPHHV